MFGSRVFLIFPLFVFPLACSTKLPPQRVEVSDEGSKAITHPAKQEEVPLIGPRIPEIPPDLVKVNDALPQSHTQPLQEAPAPMQWPKDWSSYLGKVVTIEGVAINMYVGALLQGEGSSIFIDDIAHWPADYYLGGDRGKRVRVTGTVIERHDLPVFIPRKG